MGIQYFKDGVWRKPDPAVHGNEAHPVDYMTGIIPYPIVGKMLPSYQGQAIFEGSIGAGFMVGYPQPVPYPVTVNEISIWIQIAAADSVVRLAIYKPRYPTTLTMDRVVDAGTVDASTTGLKTISLSPAVSLTEKVYYLVASTQGTNAGTVRVRTRNFANAGAFAWPGTPTEYMGNHPGYWGLTLNQGTTNTAFPNPVTWTEETGFNRPLIPLNVASIL